MRWPSLFPGRAGTWTPEILTVFIYILVLENGDLKGRGVVVCGFEDWPSILIQILPSEN